MSNVAQSPANPRPIDKDSIYYSKERWRLISQRTGRFTVQYLVSTPTRTKSSGHIPKCPRRWTTGTGSKGAPLNCPHRWVRSVGALALACDAVSGETGTKRNLWR
jgi:hypothetical protein